MSHTHRFRPGRPGEGQPGLGTFTAGDSPPLPQNRVDLLEQVTQEHEHFQLSVDEFQLWLKAVVERVHGCMGRKCRLSTKDRLSALQVTNPRQVSARVGRERSWLAGLC